MNSSKQIGNYLNQFYEFGPYVHKTDNNIPYKAAFFGAAFGDTRRLRLSMFDEIINQMRAKEEIFYRDMDVKDIADFNNKYMQGENIIKYAKQGPKGGPLMASEIPENFFKKVQYLIIVPLRNILTVKIQEQDVDKILGKIFSTKVGNKSVEELLKEIVEKNATIAVQKSEVIDDIKNNAVNLLIAANLASTSIKRDVFGSRFGMALKTQKQVRNYSLPLLRNDEGIIRLNPILQEEINSIYINEYMDKEIKTRVRKAKDLLNRQMPKIIKSSSEFDELSNAKKKEQAEFYIRIIYKIIEDWGTQTKYLSLFKNTGLMTGEVGQFAVSFTFNAQVNRDPIIKDVAEVEQIIASTIKSMSPASMHGGGEVVNYQPSGKQWKRIQSKKYNPDNPKSHQYKRYSGQVTQDVIVEGKNGRKYSFSVKNYISEILLQGVKNVALTIRTEKSMEAFMGDVMRSSPRTSVTQDDINRFVYVLVNNIFRGDSSSVLLNTFMNGLINFYLQNEFVKNLTHASTQLKQKFGGDVRNSFIVMSGMYLIPMSTILTSIRDNLQLALDQEYSGMLESSLLKIGDTNYKDSGYLMPNLQEEKQKIMKNDWLTYPAYGSEMLQLGIRAGNRIYKSVDMPTMGFKVDRLISIISSNI